LIYHLTSRRAWEAAQASGVYTLSTRNLTLGEVGFIHASYASQVARVASAFYADVPDLIVLVIDPEKLSAPLRAESVGEQTFPHIYGALNLEAVVEVRAFRADDFVTSQ
jgi:uncharacterized protein (DUF952 family)